MGLGSFLKKTFDIGLGDVAAAADIAGGFLSSKKSKSTPEISGYNSLSPEKKAFGDDVLFRDLKGLYGAPRPAMPFRRLTDAEMADDSLFAPRALQGLQRYKDYVSSQAPQQSDSDEAATATLDEMFGRMMASQMAGMGNLGMGNLMTTKLNMPMQGFMDRATPVDMQEYGRLTRGAMPAGPGMHAGGMVRGGSPLVDPALNRLMNKYRVAY